MVQSSNDGDGAVQSAVRAPSTDELRVGEECGPTAEARGGRSAVPGQLLGRRAAAEGHRSGSEAEFPRMMT